MSLRIAFLLVRHPARRRRPIIPEVIRLLTERDVVVDRVYPDEEPAPWTGVEHDLYVLKAKTEAALRLAESLHARGAATLNPYPVTALCRDKIATARTLAAAGILMPPTYVERDPMRFAPHLERGPLILKPYRGSQGRGVQVVLNVDALSAVPAGEPLMAQRYLRPDGRDHKIYRIASDCFCVRRTWPTRTYADKLGEPAELDASLLELTLRCGTALGIDLYGVDVIFHRGSPYVVDISSFPGFKGVPDAAAKLAEYIHAAAMAARVEVRST